jgi:hypothetical protein
MAITERRRKTGFIGAAIAAFSGLALTGLEAVEPWVIEGREWDTMRVIQVLLWSCFGLTFAFIARSLKKRMSAARNDSADQV